ncbi:SCO family protein [bacterium]|nr:SCO family protein [bacterium]
MQLKKYATLWLILAIVVITGGYWHYRGTHTPMVTGMEITARPLPQFQLITTTEAALTPENFRGRWSFLFFGYTHCPDICPAMMHLLAKVNASLPQGAAQFIFVSADPEQDDLPHIDNYVHGFDPSFIGATGLPADVHTLTKELHLYFSNADGNTNPMIDHSNVLLLIDPHANVVAIFNAPTSPQAVTADFHTVVRHHTE